jgi:hypothetical protein
MRSKKILSFVTSLLFVVSLAGVFPAVAAPQAPVTRSPIPLCPCFQIRLPLMSLPHCLI